MKNGRHEAIIILRTGEDRTPTIYLIRFLIKIKINKNKFIELKCVIWQPTFAGIYFYTKMKKNFCKEKRRNFVCLLFFFLD